MLIAIEVDRKRGNIEAKPLIKRRPAIALCAALIVAMVVVIVGGHMQYVKDFNLSISNQSATYVLGNSTYIGSMKANINGSVKVIIYRFLKGDADLWYRATNMTISIPDGTGNETSVVSGDNSSLLANQLVLNSGSEQGLFEVDAQRMNSSWISCGVYDQQYFYVCPAATVIASSKTT